VCVCTSLAACAVLLFCVSADYIPVVLIDFLVEGDCWFVCTGGRSSASV